MNCKFCDLPMFEFLIDRWICTNKKCEKFNLIQELNSDGDPID